MALIVITGPRYLEAAIAFANAMGWPGWDLEPDIPEVARLDVVPCETVHEALALVNEWADDPQREWISHDGWIARPMAPVEDPYAGGVQGVPL